MKLFQVLMEFEYGDDLLVNFEVFNDGLDEAIEEVEHWLMEFRMDLFDQMYHIGGGCCIGEDESRNVPGVIRVYTDEGDIV